MACLCVNVYCNTATGWLAVDKYISCSMACLCVNVYCNTATGWLAVDKYISYHIISYHIISYHIISYHIISYHIISYHIITYHIISYHISYHIISYHIISYHIISYHIISNKLTDIYETRRQTYRWNATWSSRIHSTSSQYFCSLEVSDWFFFVPIYQLRACNIFRQSDPSFSTILIIFSVGYLINYEAPHYIIFPHISLT